MAERLERSFEQTPSPTPAQGRGAIRVAGRRPVHLSGLESFRKARQVFFGVDQPPRSAAVVTRAANGGSGGVVRLPRLMAKCS
jgi:hypothetical protein